jgi:carboxymethylenebutenolidase
VPPTGRRVELPHVVVVGFDNGKIAYEHVYWDQASLLVPGCSIPRPFLRSE